MKRILALLVCCLGFGQVSSETLTLNDIQIYDSKSGKLQPAKTTFRENDVVVAGTNPEFGFISVITYASVMAIDAEVSTAGPVNAESLKDVSAGATPIGDSHTWVAVKYTDTKGAEVSVQLYAGQREDMAFLAGLAAKTGKNVARYGAAGGGALTPGMSAYDLVRSVGEPSGVVQYGERLILGYSADDLGVSVKFVFEGDKLVDVR